MTTTQILSHLHKLASPDIKAQKAKKFGIIADNSLGITQKELREFVKDIPKNNALALELFESGIYEAQMLCSMLFHSKDITEALMDHWIQAFNSWEICDSFCMRGFMNSSKFAIPKAMEWSQRKPEFEKRAGFVLMATYGFAHKKADNAVFRQFFDPMIQECCDDRIYVKKAINWALRNIGKRNIDLKQEAIAVAEKILKKDCKAAQWIAKDALRELTAEKVNVLDYPRELYRK